MDKSRGESVKRSRSGNTVPHPSSDNIARTILHTSENRIHVGSDYQAQIPECNAALANDSNIESRLLWAPSIDVSDTRVEEFLSIAKSVHGYNAEQALGMLFWHKWDFDLALADMKNFAPFPDEWPVEDKVLFEQAFISHGKNFRKLHQALPDKSVAELVKYYYLWKCRLLKEKYFKKEQKTVIDTSEDIICDVNGFSDSDEDTSSDKVDNNGLEVISAGTGDKKTDKSRGRDKTVLPKGIHMDMNEVTDVFKSSSAVELDTNWKQKVDSEQTSLLQQIKVNKQSIANLKNKASAINIDKYRITRDPSKITQTWSSEELLLAVQGLRMYGKDFQAIAEVMGTKTEQHVRNFFVTYQRRFNLDDILDEYYKEQQSLLARDDAGMDVESLDGSAFAQAPPPLVKQAPIPSQSLNNSASHQAVSQPPPLIKPDGYLLKPTHI